MDVASTSTSTTATAKVPAIGIDLGTTDTCVAVWQNEQMGVIPNKDGERTSSSYVAFTENDQVIGSLAKQQLHRNDTNTIYDAKRLIGRRFNDPVVAKEYTANIGDATSQLDQDKNNATTASHEGIVLAATTPTAAECSRKRKIIPNSKELDELSAIDAVVDQNASANIGDATSQLDRIKIVVSELREAYSAFVGAISTAVTTITTATTAECSGKRQKIQPTTEHTKRPENQPKHPPFHGVRTYDCAVCKITFNREQFISHIKKEKKKDDTHNVYCEICCNDKQGNLPLEKGVARHDCEINVKRKEEVYYCTLCEKLYAHHSSYYKHYNAKHE